MSVPPVVQPEAEASGPQRWKSTLPLGVPEPPTPVTVAVSWTTVPAATLLPVDEDWVATVGFLHSGGRARPLTSFISDVPPEPDDLESMYTEANAWQVNPPEPLKNTLVKSTPPSK